MQYYIILSVFIVGILYLIRKILIQEKNLANNNTKKGELELHSIIGKISNLNKNKLLGGQITKNIYRPGSLTRHMKYEMSLLLKPIIENISKTTNKKYIIDDFEAVIVEKDSNKNTKYLIDFFVQNLSDNFSTKLISEIYVDNMGISTINFVKESNNLVIQAPSKIDGSDIHNIGTNQVIKNDNTEDLNQLQHKPSIIGANKINIDNSKVSFKTHVDGIQENSFLRNDWIQPICAQKLENSGTKVFPCRQIYNQWNHQGVQKTEINCNGINSSCSKRRVVGSYNPTITELPRDNLGLNAMFDLAVGIPSFPTSTCKPSNN